MPLRAALTATVVALLLAAPAHALLKLPLQPQPVRGNPANPLSALPIEDAEYDPATKCKRGSKPGMVAFERWLRVNAPGASWGTYRCERWGRGSASLHAEGRALDWHLNAADPTQAREARRLITLLLAPDTAGNAQALARRMGVQEIIWDCGYWSAGRGAFAKYPPCFKERGKRRRVSATVAHRDHVHFGLTKAGAARRTSFWTRGR